MNLAIIGHGKMGRLIEQLAPEYDFAVTQPLNSQNNRDTSGITRNNFPGVAVAFALDVVAAGPACWDRAAVAFWCKS